MTRIAFTRTVGFVSLLLLHACKKSDIVAPVEAADQRQVRPRPEQAPGVTAPPTGTTRAQKLRAEMTADELRTIREELASMHSKNRWPADDQYRYLKSCEAAKKDDASINRRLCECPMEVVMNKFTAASEYARHLKDHDGQPDDKELSALFGLCTTVYGD